MARMRMGMMMVMLRSCGGRPVTDTCLILPQSVTPVPIVCLCLDAKSMMMMMVVVVH